MTILVIVESRAKAPKIESILGSAYTVRPCYGHVQDIPSSLKWVKEHEAKGWDPATIPYVPSSDAKNQHTLRELRALVQRASKVIIASDMDREGEAIGYHLCDVLKLREKKVPTERIVFDQITPEAIKAAVANPTTLREPLYRAQQARRVIDIMFGYTVSPLLWGIAHKLSAGRCQSPALRWLWERQVAFLNAGPVDPKHEIVVHLSRQLQKQGTKATGGRSGPRGSVDDGATFHGKYHSAADAATDGAEAADQGSVNDAALKELATFPYWRVVDTKATQPHQSPPVPLTTSALQQKAYAKWKWSPKRTMGVAQKLYEGGHITYMRTDCKVLAAPFVREATAYLHDRFGPEYVRAPTTGAADKGKGKGKGKQAHAQEAHEPVRPVYANRPPEKLGSAEPAGRQLYTLIYETTMASLMPPCVLNKVAVTLHPHVEPAVAGHVVKADCTEMHFPGHRVWEVLDALPWSSSAPDVSIGDVYDTHVYESTVRYPIANKPYTSGDLLKLLETRGVGRPSTYGAILETLDRRRYSVTGDEAPWRPVLAGHPLSTTQNKTVRVEMQHPVPKWSEQLLDTDLAKQLKDRYLVTPLGTEVATYLTTHLTEMIDADFTRQLEDDLDAIVQGTKTYPEVVGGFYTVLRERIAKLKPLQSNGNGNGNGSVPAFVNGHARRVLHETPECTYVAMQTKTGPAVAKLYTDPKRKAESVFANLPADQMATVTYAEAVAIIAAKATAPSGGRALAVGQGTTYVKHGPYGAYLEWKDALDRTQRTPVPKDVLPEAVTPDQAAEYMRGAQLTLHDVSATFAVKYSGKKDSVYLSKRRPKGQKGRPTYAPLDGFQKDDLAKFQALTVAECERRMTEAQERKYGAKTSKVGRNGSASGHGATAKAVKQKVPATKAVGVKKAAAKKVVKKKVVVKKAVVKKKAVAKKRSTSNKQKVRASKKQVVGGS